MGTDKRGQVRTVPTAELWSELRHILIPLWSAGIIALTIAISMGLSGLPRVSKDWIGPALLVFGGFVCAHAVASVQQALHEWAVGRSLRDTLHPGQFAFVLLGLVLLAALAVLLLAGSLMGVHSLINPRFDSGTWVASLIQWGAGAIALAVSLWMVVIPFRALFQWFGARQEQQRVRDDALLALASSRADK